MVNFDQAKLLIEKKFPDSIVNCGMKGSSGYIFSIEPKNWKRGEILLDGLFRVSFSDGQITEYSAVLNPAEFKNALNNILYRR